MNPVEITLEIKNRIADVALVGTCIHQLARYHRLAEEQCFEVELCVVEAVTNCVRHAYADDEEGLVRVKARFRRRQPPQLAVLEVEVQDRGRPIPERWRPGTGEFRFLDDGEFEEGGRGMFLITQLMDHVRSHSDEHGNTLHMTKTFRLETTEVPAAVCTLDPTDGSSSS